MAAIKLVHGPLARLYKRDRKNVASVWSFVLSRVKSLRQFSGEKPWFIRGQALSSQAIRGTTDSHSVLNKHMGIDLGGANIFVPEKFLNGADIGAGSEQMSGEGMA